MNTIVIGLGSMGRRRIRLLQKYDSTIRIIGVDSQEQRRVQATNELSIETCESMETVSKICKCEVAFICTSPLSHAELINQCLLNEMHVFTEINLVTEGYQKNIQTAKEKGKILFLSSTPMYRREMQWIKEQVYMQSMPVSYQYHVGNYLPDWHPWESYKNFFVCDSRTGGCREFMAIEFPWLIDTFGEVEKFNTIAAKTTSLNLEYDDTRQILLKHKNGNIGNIQIDVSSRKAERDFKCVGENIYVTWGGTPESLYAFDIEQKNDKKIMLYEQSEHLSNYNKTIIEDAYYDEIVNFMDAIHKGSNTKYSFERDAEILHLIDRIEGDK